MNWTKEVPVGAGYYWWRLGTEYNNDPFVVLIEDGKIKFPGTHSMYHVADPNESGKKFNTPAEAGGEWCGPLLPPSQEKACP